MVLLSTHHVRLRLDSIRILPQEPEAQHKEILRRETIIHQMMVREYIKGKHLFHNLGEVWKRRIQLLYIRYTVRHKRRAVSP